MFGTNLSVLGFLIGVPWIKTHTSKLYILLMQSYVQDIVLPQLRIGISFQGSDNCAGDL